MSNSIIRPKKTKRIELRVDTELHQDVTDYAVSQNTTITSLIVEHLRLLVGEHKKSKSRYDDFGIEQL